MKLIIAGGRNFNDYSLVKSKLDHLLANHTGVIEIVSGKAKGADSLGERYAKEHNHTVKEFPADWDQYGKKAGFMRNTQMADYGTHLIAFWDGVSVGTKMMIGLATDKGLKVKVVRY